MHTGHTLGRSRFFAAALLLLLFGSLSLPRMARAADVQLLREWNIPVDPMAISGGPTGITVDASDNVLVADGMYSVLRFDSTGALTATWGGSDIGNGPGEFVFPRAITVGPSGDIYVGNHNYRVQRLSPDGTHISFIGTGGSGDGQFDGIRGLAVDSAGNLYASEYLNFRIQKFNAAGTYQAQWGSGVAGGFPFTPYGLTLDEQNDVYVCEYFNKRIQRFTSAGVFVDSWDTPNMPRAIVRASNGHFFVSSFDAIWEFTPDGTLVDTWDTASLGAGSIDGWGLAIDSANNLYLTDDSAMRVVAFSTGITPPPPAEPTPPVASVPASSTGSTALLLVIGAVTVVALRIPSVRRAS